MDREPLHVEIICEQKSENLSVKSASGQYYNLHKAVELGIEEEGISSEVLTYQEEIENKDKNYDFDQALRERVMQASSKATLNIAVGISNCEIVVYARGIPMDKPLFQYTISEEEDHRQVLTDKLHKQEITYESLFCLGKNIARFIKIKPFS